MKNISLNVSAANHILIEELDSALNSCLAVLGESLKACRCYVYTIQNECLKESHLWIKYNFKKLNNTDLPLLNYLYKTIPDIFTPLLQGEHIIGSTKEIKEQLFRKIMTKRKVETYLFIPIFENDMFWFFLGFEHFYSVQWIPETIEWIKVFAKNISIKINEIRYKLNVGPSFDIFKYYNQSISEGIWELDVKTFETKMCNNWTRILGFSIYEIEQTYDFWQKRVHPDDIINLEKLRQEYISGQVDEYFGIYRLENKENQYIWVKSSGTIKRSLKGEPIKIIGTIVDVNEIQINKIALEESKKKMRFILENSSDLITQRDIITNLIATYFNNEIDGREVVFITVGSPRLIKSDASLLIHIFTNLLNNAFKYSKGKQNPVLRVAYSEENVQIEVIDYGIGIPDQDIKNLFKSFFRASNTTTIIESGLVLTIVKQFTRTLKGKIKLKTKENSGTKIL